MCWGLCFRVGFSDDWIGFSFWNIGFTVEKALLVSIMFGYGIEHFGML